MIEAAGDNGTVTQYTQLIPKSVAEYGISTILCLQIRPVELITVFQKYPVSDADSPTCIYPFSGKSGMHC